jgi:single-strand DNA-binding protein
MNNWVGIGRLIADPEVRYASESQKAIAKFKIAIDDGYGDKKSTDFIPITCFGKTAENVERFLSKGKMCGVSGKIKTGSYTNKEGVKIYTTDVLAERVEFLSPKESGATQPDGVPEGFEAVDDDSIPF